MKNYYSKGMLNIKSFIFTTAFGIFSSTSLLAQENILFDVMNDHSDFIVEEKIENGTTNYLDKNGEEIKINPVYQLSLAERVEKGYTSIVKGNKSNKTGEAGVAIQLTFLDVVNQTGFGFDDPTLGASRRATVEKAVEYYANMITNTGWADLEIKESVNVNGWALAEGGQYYYKTPGFQNGTMFRHLTTGVDPSSSMPDAQITFNFYYTYNSDYTKMPSSNEYDLLTVSIHELGHALGFISMSTSNGGSQLTPGAYSSYDQLLESDEYNKLFSTTSSSNSSIMFSSTSSELATNGVVFDLGNGTYGAVYSPNPFNASSLDHFDSNRLTDGGKYSMHPSLAKGVVVRQLHLHEAIVLEKIGYQIDFSDFSTSALIDPSLNNQTKFSIYPNPVANGEAIALAVNAAKDQVISILVYDVLGNLVYKLINIISSPGNSIQLPIHHSVSSGTYFVQVQGENIASKQILVVE